MGPLEVKSLLLSARADFFFFFETYSRNVVEHLSELNQSDVSLLVFVSRNLEFLSDLPILFRFKQF